MRPRGPGTLAAAGLTAVLTAVLTAGCGVPVTGQPEVLSTTNVPYKLLRSPTPSVTATPAPETTPPTRIGEMAVRVAFVVDDQKVVLERRVVPVGSPAQMAQNLLGQLQAGPTETEHNDGLGSAIPSSTGLTAQQVSGGLVTIDVTGESPVQASGRIPLAVAQIVLTATSQPGVNRVLLLRDGRPVTPPLPNGALTTGKELTRRDYQSLIRR